MEGFVQLVQEFYRWGALFFMVWIGIGIVACTYIVLKITDEIKIERKKNSRDLRTDFPPFFRR